jgi:hypothetical protein
MALVNISLDTANRFYSWGWRGSIIGALITAVAVCFLMWGTRVRDRDTETRLASLNLEAAQSRERAAIIEERLLQEQRRLADARWRLERVERGALPRDIPAPQAQAIVEGLREIKGLGTINIVVAPNADEPNLFAERLRTIFQQAGVGVRTTVTMPASPLQGTLLYRGNAAGDQLAALLWRITGRYFGGSTSVRPLGLEGLPQHENALLIGPNDAAMQPGDGQPGEGIDEHGNPVPAP